MGRHTSVQRVGREIATWLRENQIDPKGVHVVLRAFHPDARDAMARVVVEDAVRRRDSSAFSAVEVDGLIIVVERNSYREVIDP